MRQWRNNKFVSCAAIILIVLEFCSCKKTGRLEFLGCQAIVLYDSSYVVDSYDISILTSLTLFNSSSDTVEIINICDSVNFNYLGSSDFYSETSRNDTIYVSPFDTISVFRFTHAHSHQMSEEDIAQTARTIADSLIHSSLRFKLKATSQGIVLDSTLFLKPSKSVICRKYSSFLCMNEEDWGDLKDQFKGR